MIHVPPGSQVHKIKIPPSTMLKAGFEPRISGLGSDRSAQCATATAQKGQFLISLPRLRWSRSRHPYVRPFVRSYYTCSIFQQENNAPIVKINLWTDDDGDGDDDGLDNKF